MSPVRDVVVIGAGPAGSQVAARLAASGHDILVIDRKRGLGEVVCCSGIIGQECISGYAVDDGIIHRWAKSARLFSPSGRQIRVWRSSPQAAILDRAGLNVALASRAQGRGARYMLDTDVRGIDIAGDRATVSAVRRDGPVTVEARAVVVASGYGGGLVGGLGLGRIGDSALGAQAEVIAPGIEEVEVYCGDEVAPGFFGWLVPTAPGVALAGLIARREPAALLDRLISRLIAEGKAESVNVAPSYRPIPLRPLPRTFSDRLLVVGGAAGQSKPTTGGGVYYGLLCADIAAEYLDRALGRDDLSARRLAGYQRDWKKRLGGELRTGYWGRRVYERLSDAQIDRVFDVMESAGILEALAAAEDLSFDWHGGAIVRALGYQTLLKTIAAAGLPAALRRRLFGQGGVAAGN